MMLNIMRARKEKLALHKLFKLRQRYVLTKNNRFRLRYITGASAIIIAASTGMFSAISHSDAAFDPNESFLKESSARSYSDSDDTQYASLSPASGTNDEARAQDDGSEQQSPGALERASNVVSGLFGGNDKEQGDAPASAASNGDGAYFKVKLSDSHVATAKEKTVTLDSGDTIADVLEKAGVSGADAYNAVAAMSDHLDPRKVRPGNKIVLNFEPDFAQENAADQYKFSAMRIKIDPTQDVVVTRGANGDFGSKLVEKPVETVMKAGHAKIETSLYGSALKAGIPAPVVAELIHIYSWNVDFQRDIRQGDKIEVLYEAKETKDGDLAHYGNILYASLSIGGKNLPIYRFEESDGHVDYFERDGHSIKRALMKTPVDGARISSGFGMRHHPILGYTKMHKGIDFAAPLGTPIYAAGDGIIDFAGRNGGYGNYIRIRHNSRLKTAYGHMHKFAKNIGKGARVKQGEIIGYVGSTGRSTGPHVHYEVQIDGKQVNPNSVNVPTGEQLKGKPLQRFKDILHQFDQEYASLAGRLKVASDESKSAGQGSKNGSL